MYCTHPNKHSYLNTYLTLKAIWVIVPAERPQPRRRLLPVLGHDGVPAEGAPGRLLLVVVLRAVDPVLVVRDERHVDHVPLADDADEAVGVVGGAADAHALPANLLLALGTLVALLLVALLAEHLAVVGVHLADGRLAAAGARVGALLKESIFFHIAESTCFKDNL